MDFHEAASDEELAQGHHTGECGNDPREYSDGGDGHHMVVEEEEKPGSGGPGRSGILSGGDAHNLRAAGEREIILRFLFYFVVFCKIVKFFACAFNSGDLVFLRHVGLFFQPHLSVLMLSLLSCLSTNRHALSHRHHTRSREPSRPPVTTARRLRYLRALCYSAAVHRTDALGARRRRQRRRIHGNNA